jgi:hypothetical protein
MEISDLGRKQLPVLNRSLTPTSLDTTEQENNSALYKHANII